MEKQIDESTGLIVESIEKQAERECARLKQLADDLYAKKVAALEAEIKSKYDRQINYELEKQRIEANQKESVLEADHKAALAKARHAVAQEIYQAAEERIKAFAKSENYLAFLEHSVRTAKDLYDGKAVICLRPCDETYKTPLETAFGRKVSFETDDSIKLGGIKIRFTEAAVMADDTLDARFEAQKKAFVKSSGLGCEE